ncbi:MAG TPA: hypothetical protein VIG24_04955 [Acidimicrobiia bacterium]
MTFFLSAASYVAALAIALAFNRGAHRKPSPRRVLHCWFDFEDGHTCLLEDGHDGPHEQVPDSDISVTFTSGADDTTETGWV